jgi:hypothetical protein
VVIDFFALKVHQHPNAQFTTRLIVSSMELGMEIDGELVVARELLKKCFQVWASHWKSAAFVRSCSDA